MSYRDEGELAPLSLPSFLRLVGVMVAWRIGLYARSKQADESDVFSFFFLLRKAAVTSSWPATLETSRAQFHAVLATHRGPATPMRVMSGTSLSRSTSQK